MAVLSASPLATARLLLPVITDAEARDMVEGLSRDGWAAGYPREDDRDAARTILDLAPRGADSMRWGPRHVVLVETGLAVGSIGFFGSPEQGSVEIGYGLVESARRQGLAGEAVDALVAVALDDPAVRVVVAHTEPDNLPSQRLLHRWGFEPAGASDAGEPRYRRRAR